MNAHLSKPLFLTVVLAAAGLACNALTSASTPTKAPPLSTPSDNAGKVLIRDDFTDRSTGWGTGTHVDSSVEYAGGLAMKVFKTHYFVSSTPNKRAYQDIHIEVTIENKSAEDLATFGVICDKQATAEGYYYFAISPNGEYGISKAAAGKDDVVLTNNGNWSVSNWIPKNAKTYKVGVDCGKGMLTLYVEGRKIASVQDDTYTKGAVGLFAWSGEKESGTSVVFHQFLMTSLK
jgi:hypothetical protein